MWNFIPGPPPIIPFSYSFPSPFQRCLALPCHCLRPDCSMLPSRRRRLPAPSKLGWSCVTHASPALLMLCCPSRLALASHLKSSACIFAEGSVPHCAGVSWPVNVGHHCQVRQAIQGSKARAWPANDLQVLAERQQVQISCPTANKINESTMQ